MSNTLNELPLLNVKSKPENFVGQFFGGAPSRNDGQMLDSFVAGTRWSVVAASYLAGIRHNWHVVIADSYRTTDAEKELLRTLPWWTEPEPPKQRAKEPCLIVHLRDGFPEIVATLKMPKTDTKLGKALSTWKTEGMPNKEHFDAVVVEELAKVPDADTRAKVKTLFDDLPLPPIVGYLRAALDQWRVTKEWPSSTDKEHGGAGFSNWKRQGCNHKAEVEAFFAGYLAKMPDAEERAMMRVVYDKNMTKRPRSEANPAKGAKKARA